LALLGLRKVVDFQDVAYGRCYLDLLDEFVSMDQVERDYALSIAAAKYIANAMAYDDVFRVADLKTLASRISRIETEMAAQDKTLQLTEFLHPRAEEIVGMLPAKMGARIEANERWMSRLDRWFSRGRRIRSLRIGGFLSLYLLGGLRFYRLRTLRHKYERDHLNHWLETCRNAVVSDYDYACELLRCRRLIKGYSDTHQRGQSKFDKVMMGAKLVKGRNDAAKWVVRLRDAALQDEKGTALDGAIETIRSFT
jgi:indolepyruvate ferredoxin oxidoreductase beta subunit